MCMRNALHVRLCIVSCRSARNSGSLRTFVSSFPGLNSITFRYRTRSQCIMSDNAGDIDWNSYAAEYVGDEHVNEYGKIAFEHFNSEFPGMIVVGEGSTALDFGTGGGNFAFQLSEHGVEKVVALDPAENMIEHVKKVINERCVKGVIPFVGSADEYARAAEPSPASGGASPVAVSEGSTALPQAFNLITMSSVLAFVPNKPATLQCLAGMLRGKDSHIVHWDWLGGESKTEGEEDSGITQEQVKHLHAECGLETVHCGIGFKYMDMSVVLGIAKKP